MDLEIGGPRTMGCSALTLAFTTILAAGLLLTLPAASAASYTNADIGASWALIKAETKKSGLPTTVTIGMFRICYATPGVSCLAFQWGLSVDRVAFQGSDKWAKVLPPTAYTQAWALLAAAAFILTFLAAFAYCNCAPMPFIVGIACLAAGIDLSYIGLTVGLFVILKQRIASDTDYEPKLVPLTLGVFIAAVAVLAVVPVLTMALERKQGDTLSLPTYVMAQMGNRGDGTSTRMLARYLKKQEDMMALLVRRDKGGTNGKDGELDVTIGDQNEEKPNPYLENPALMAEAQRLTSLRNQLEQEDHDTIAQKAVELQIKVIAGSQFIPEMTQVRRNGDMRDAALQNVLGARPKPTKANTLPLPTHTQGGSDASPERVALPRSLSDPLAPPAPMPEDEVVDDQSGQWVEKQRQETHLDRLKAQKARAKIDQGIAQLVERLRREKEADRKAADTSDPPSSGDSPLPSLPPPVAMRTYPDPENSTPAPAPVSDARIEDAVTKLRQALKKRKEKEARGQESQPDPGLPPSPTA